VLGAAVRRPRPEQLVADIGVDLRGGRSHHRSEAHSVGLPGRESLEQGADVCFGLGGAVAESGQGDVAVVRFQVDGAKVGQSGHDGVGHPA
jgi:hypothetical protein